MRRWFTLTAIALSLASCSSGETEQSATPSDTASPATSEAPRPGTQTYDSLADLYSAAVDAGGACGPLVEDPEPAPALARGTCAVPTGDVVLHLYGDAATRISNSKSLRTAQGEQGYCFVSGNGSEDKQGAWLIDARVDRALCRTLSSELPGTLINFEPPPPPPDFTFECYEQTYSGPTPTFTALDQVWTAAATSQFRTCSVEVRPGYTPTPNDLAAVEAYRQFVPSETPEGALNTMLGICAESWAADDDVLRWQPTVVHGAALLCPTAPHTALLRARGDAALVADGTFVVGQTILPGTWRTDPGVRDCYWERTSGSGDIIDNNFVTFAPAGATVTIRSSDGGFVSERCGIWRRVG